MGIKRIIREELKESEDFDWIKGVSSKLSKNSDWWIINDVDPHSLKVSEEIQDFLFKQGFAWMTKTTKFLPNPLVAISYRGGTYPLQSGRFGYYPPTTDDYNGHTVNDIEEYEIEDGDVIYYWGELSKISKINESDKIKNIIKIIKEEIDGLEWIRENPIEVGKCFRVYTHKGDIYGVVTIKEMEQREWEDNIYQKGDKFNPNDVIIHLVGVTKKDKKRIGPNFRITYNGLVQNINNGDLVPTNCE